MSGASEQKGCGERSLLAELAIGSLNGAERAALLGHLESCQACRDELAELLAAADGLLLLAPALEPPVGFEVGLVGRAPGSPAGSLRAGRRWLGRAAAGLLLLAAGAGIGGALASSPPSSGRSVRAPGLLRLAVLHSKEGASGMAALAAGPPGRLVMRVSGLERAYWVECVVTDGHHGVSLGRFALSGGRGDWTVRLPALIAPRAIESAELVGPGGTVLARADFAR